MRNCMGEERGARDEYMHTLFPSKLEHLGIGYLPDIVEDEQHSAISQVLMKPASQSINSGQGLCFRGGGPQDGSPLVQDFCYLRSRTQADPQHTIGKSLSNL